MSQISPSEALKNVFSAPPPSKGSRANALFRSFRFHVHFFTPTYFSTLIKHRLREATKKLFRIVF